MPTMPFKKSSIISFLFLAAIIILAALFYWQINKSKEINIANLTGKNKTANVSEEELSAANYATSTPNIALENEISRGNPNKKQIIFTFDCGAGNNSADKILAVAQKHNVKLTFFATGKFAEKYPETIKKIAAAGHEIFNHTYSHPHLTQIADEEIKNELEKTDKIISDLTGLITKPYFRPPYGDRNQHVLDIAKEIGFHSVYWTTDALDWMPDKTADQVKQRIYSSLKNGEIILMHVGDDITGNILDEVFTKVENEGYKITNLSEGLK